ncbi:MAG: metallophosphoesterase, partial [Acidobacteriia bacterium]|nr:metallophosphoesterase [Terriglobia bacterium]
RIYAIGDIHGRLDLLDLAIGTIRSDVAERGPAALTVTIGDYIDRGPDSCGVSRRVRFSAGEPTKIMSLFFTSSSESKLPRLTRICRCSKPKVRSRAWTASTSPTPV